jgi:hypothetical protein
MHPCLPAAGGCAAGFDGRSKTPEYPRLARTEQRESDASGATRNVVPQQETLAIGAVNWHMIDASATPDQSLYSARVSLLVVPGER